MLPKAVLIKPEFFREFKIMAKLPFACYASGIARRLQMVGKGNRLGIHVTKIDVVANIVKPRHQLHPCGRA